MPDSNPSGKFEADRFAMFAEVDCRSFCMLSGSYAVSFRQEMTNNDKAMNARNFDVDLIAGFIADTG